MKPMKQMFTFLINWTDPLGRLAYGLVGTVLFFVKYNLDRFVASFYFDRFWTPLHYLSPTHRSGLSELTPDERALFTLLVALSVPFVYVGVMLTVRRLRSSGLNPLFSGLFFVPFVNVLFFLTLCVLPEQSGDEGGTNRPEENPSGINWFIPSSWRGSVLFSSFIPAAVAVPVLLLCTSIFQHYGWGVFVGIPFVVGCCSVLLHGYRKERNLGECLLVSMLSEIMLALFLVGLAIEGVLCLVILLPIAALFGLVGGIVGYVVQRATHPATSTVHRMCLVLFLSLPVLLGFEGQQMPEAPLLKVTTSIRIDAPRDDVWDEVIAFSELDPPEDWLFSTGIAYPTRARLEGSGEDAVRYCEFSTGPFVEPIEVWEKPRTLSFSVRKQPPPMKELSPYGHIETPHLDGFFLSKRGRFDLERLPGNRTKLIGTTWYKHKVWPVVYFRIWSDWTIQRIHQRVLRHIREEAEQISKQGHD